MTTSRDDVYRAAADAPEPMTIAQMRRHVRCRIGALQPRTVSATEAVGSTLAEALCSDADLPSLDTSAMDGYAVSGGGPWRLRMDVLAAGALPGNALAEGEAIRIATGAVTPWGTTSILRDERSRRLTGDLLVAAGPPPAPGSDIRRRGENWFRGTVLADLGTRVTPALLATALSAETTRLVVRGPVAAHVVITGDEICLDGPLRPGGTRDSLGPALPYWLSAAGYRVVSTSYRTDQQLRQGIGLDAPGAHVVFVIGGTGRGAADHLRSVLAESDGEIIIDQIRCRPGGSQLMALLPDGRVVVGLPGNPLAAVSAVMTTGHALASTLMAAQQAPPCLGQLGSMPPHDTSGTRIYPASQETDGRWSADRGTRSAHLCGLIGRQALALIESHTKSGDWIELLPLPT
jgi:molybdopterin molybdotransferase